MPIWVRLLNLPRLFYHHKVLEEIRNSIGKFTKVDLERMEKVIFTFIKTYVEMDLSKVILDYIPLKHKNF